MPDKFNVVIQSTRQVIDSADAYKAAEVLRGGHESRLGGEAVRVELAAPPMLSKAAQDVAAHGAARTIKSTRRVQAWDHGGRKPTRSVVTQRHGGTLTLNYFD